MPASEVPFRFYIGGAPNPVNIPIFEIQTSATDSPLITRIGICATLGFSNSTTTVFGLGTPAAKGVIRPNWIVPVLDSGADNSSVANLTVGIDWTTPPTAPTNYLRRMTVQTQTLGNIPTSFDFPNGFRITPSSSLVMFVILNNGSLAVALDYSVEFDG